MPDRPLSLKQQKFITAFMGEAAGNATKAAELAGYSPKTAAVIASQNLRKPQIVAAIRTAVADDPKIATRTERQQFWTKFLQDEDLTPLERLRASELLGKSQADFTDKTDHSGEVHLRVTWGS